MSPDSVKITLLAGYTYKSLRATYSGIEDYELEVSITKKLRARRLFVVNHLLSSSPLTGFPLP